MTWAIDTYACNNLQASNYYSVSYYVSTYVGATTTDSTQLYTSSLTDVLPTAMGLVYSWLLWKLPLMVFAYHACNRQPSLGMKLLSVSVLTIVMAAIDILGTIFLLSIYN